jgi:carbon monoxide dehydrogenase subunit G
MKAITASRDVNASADVVWGILTDLEGSVDTISAIEKVEILSDDTAFGVGFAWRETRTMFGRTATEEMEVIEVTPGEAYAVEADPDGSNYRSVMSVAATGDGTSTVSMEFSADPNSAFARMIGATVGRLFIGSMKKAIAADLEDIAAAAEATA